MKKAMLSLAICLHINLFCDIEIERVNKKISYVIEGGDVKKLIDIAKPIIDKKYQEYAQLFNNTALNEEQKIIDIARIMAITRIYNTPDDIFKEEASIALKAVESIILDKKIKVITINSLIRTAITDLTSLMNKWIKQERLTKPITKA